MARKTNICLCILAGACTRQEFKECRRAVHVNAKVTFQVQMKRPDAINFVDFALSEGRERICGGGGVLSSLSRG